MEIRRAVPTDGEILFDIWLRSVRATHTCVPESECQGRGGGQRSVRHAQALHGELTVDVNEQNSAARGFYEACGFVVEGRSPLSASSGGTRRQTVAPCCGTTPRSASGMPVRKPGLQVGNGRWNRQLAVQYTRAYIGILLRVSTAVITECADVTRLLRWQHRLFGPTVWS